MDVKINEELLADVKQYVEDREEIIALAFIKATLCFIKEDPQALEDTLKEIAIAFAYSYTDYCKKREETLNNLFFKEKE